VVGLKKTEIVHRSSSVVALFNVYSDPGELIAEASELARRRGVCLEAIAIDAPLRAWLISFGRGMSPLPVLPVSAAAEEDAVVRGVARLMGTVPPDVSVRWRIFKGSRRQAMREATGATSLPGPAGVRPEPLGTAVLATAEPPVTTKSPRRSLWLSRYRRN
jgi:hypothetical protein